MILIRPQSHCKSRLSHRLLQHLSPSHRTYATPQTYKAAASPTITKPSLTSSPTSSETDVLNPPPTTLPPPLELPTRTDGSSAPKHYYRLGKAYVTFYKTGFKQIYRNCKTASLLPALPTSSRRRIQNAVLANKLSRAEYQLLLRVRRDLQRLPFFALVFAICGEFTPLLVKWLTPVVPPSLRLPSQIAKVREKAERRRRESERGSGLRLGGPVRWDEVEMMPLTKREVLIRHLARSWGCYPGLWDRMLGDGVPVGVFRWRVRRRVGELEVDDFAIERDGGVGRLVGEEAGIACEMRGLNAGERDEGGAVRALGGWLKGRRGKGGSRSLIETRVEGGK